MKNIELNKSANRLLIYILTVVVVCLFGTTSFFLERWFDGMNQATIKVTESINELNIQIQELKTVLDYINRDVQKLKEKK